jgi:WD40 repeat protein
MAVVKRIHWKSMFFAALFFCIAVLFLMACNAQQDQTQPSPTVLNTPVPINTQIQLPDLVIRSLTVIGDPGILCPSPDQPYQISVLVENQGNSEAGPFVVQLNLDQKLENTRLRPGERVEVTFPGYDPNPRAIVDVTSLVTEGDESNNQTFQKLLLPSPMPDCVATVTPEIAVQEPLTVLEGHTAKVWDVEFSPDGKEIASGSVDNTLRLWNVEQARLLRTMQGHPFPILSVKYSPNGATLVTGSTDGLLRSWDVASGRMIRTYAGHNGWITGLDISRDGNWIVSSSEDSTVRLWRFPNSPIEQIIDEGMSGVKSTVFTPDSLAIAWGEVDGTIRLRTISGLWLKVIKNSSQPVTSLQFSPDGEYLVSGFNDGVILVWRLNEDALVQSLRGHVDSINDLAFSPDGQWLVSASQDHSLRLWKFENGKFLPLPVRVFQGHDGAVTSVDFSPSAPLIASGSDDSTIRLWSLPEQ